MPSAQRDLYEVLGVSRGANADELKKAYRRKAMEFHPDRNKAEDAADRFKEVNRAYEVLSDSNLRARYDRFGHAGVDQNGGAGPQGFEGFADFDGFGDIFDTFFGGSRGSRRGRRGPSRGADLRVALELTFEEAVFGCEKEITYPRAQRCDACEGSGAAPGTQPETCTTCNGSGEVRRSQQSIFGQFVNVATCTRCDGEGRVINSPCVVCRGAGRTKQDHTISVKVPAGVDTGQQIRLSGEGEIGPRGGQPGNLYVVLKVQDHPQFERADQHILYELPVNIAAATLGTKVTIPTLDGEHEIEVPASTQTGEEFVLRGKGIPHLRGKGRGDMVVRVTVVTPENLSDEQRELMEKLAQTMGTPPLPKRSKGLFERLRDAMAG